MRLAGVLLAALALAVLAAAALAVLNLRTFVAAHGAEVVRRAERVVARPLRVGKVSPAWLPPGILLADTTVGEDPRFGDAPFVVAPAVRIVVHPWALVRGRVEVARVVLERPHLRFTRAGDGRWNVASLGQQPSDPAPPGAARRGRRAGRGVRIPVEWVAGIAHGEIRDGRIEVEDRRSPARRLVAHHLRLRVENVRLGGAARLRLEAAVFADGRPDTRLELEIPRFGENDVDHTPVAARIALRDVDLAALADLLRHPGGGTGRIASLDVEASGTSRGFVAVLAARAPARKLRLGRLAASPAAPVDLRVRAVYAADVVALEEVRLAAGALDLGLTGKVELRPWRAHLETRTFGGVLSAMVEAADQGAGSVVRAEGSALDLAALVPHLVPGSAERVEGTADATLVVTLPVGSRRRSATGSGRLTVRDARVRDLNLADAALGTVRGIQVGPRLLSARVRQRYAEVFAHRDTRIRRAVVPFTIAGEGIVSEQVTIVGEAYEIVAAGRIGFDRRVRMQGDLLLSPALSAALAADVRAVKYLRGADGRVAVPLRMRGRLGDARPEADVRRLRALGLQALVDGRAGRRDRRGPRAAPEAGERRDVERIERDLLDHIERMVRP